MPQLLLMESSAAPPPSTIIQTKKAFFSIQAIDENKLIEEDLVIIVRRCHNCEVIRSSQYRDAKTGSQEHFDILCDADFGVFITIRYNDLGPEGLDARQQWELMVMHGMHRPVYIMDRMGNGMLIERSAELEVSQLETA